MVQVTFNEKVECHSYTPFMEETIPRTRNGEINCPSQIASTIGQGQPRFQYEAAFLKNLRNSPLARICPDVVKEGISAEKGWATTTSTRPYGRGSVFNNRPQQPYNYSKLRRPLVPYYGRDDFFTSVPIGYNHPTNYSNRNQPKRPSQRDYVTDEDSEPLWVKDGPTSRNEVIDLHGFDGPENGLPGIAKNDQFGSVDANSSGGPNSGASSHTSSPPAKSTPAKVTPASMKNDSQRNKRTPLGRSNNWQNNFDNRQYGGAPLLTEFFKNFPANKCNSGVLPPIVRVEDVESALMYERMKFKQLVAQMQSQQNYIRNAAYLQQEPVPTASQILTEIDKILRTNTEAIFKRPEVRSLIKNIVESVIPPFNIMNLLKSPLTEPQNRETIHAALRLITQAKINAIATIRMHTPTESELRAHMDAIMQDAIIKRRMENLNRELLKMSYQQSGRNSANIAHSFHQMFPPNSVGGRSQNVSQADPRGQIQQVASGAAISEENYLNRWFSTTLLNKALDGELPPIPVSDTLRSADIEEKLKAIDRDVK